MSAPVILAPAPSIPDPADGWAPLTAEPRWRPALRRAGLVVAAGLPLLFFAVFFVYPVGSLLGRGLLDFPDATRAGSGAPGGIRGFAEGFWEVLQRARFRRILQFTVEQAAASAGLCLLLGVPGAHLLYRCRFRGRTALRALLTIPFVLPTVVVGLAFRTLFAADGALGSWGWDGSVWAILAAHVFLNYAVVLRIVGPAWARLDRRPAEAARTLGAGPTRTLFTVVVPALGPSLAGAFLMVFLFCATSFGVVLILGGGALSTLETEIYRQTTEQLDLRTAAVLSVLQILLVAAVLIIGARLRRRTEVALRLRSTREFRRPLRLSDLPAALVTAGAAVLVAGPLGVLLVRSLRTPAGWGFGNYQALGGIGEHNVLLVSGAAALENSLRTAAVAASMAVALAVLLAVSLARRPARTHPRSLLAGVRNGLDGLVMLPLGVSAVTLGFGFLLALDSGPLDLRASALLLPIAQALVATPLVIRMVLPVLRGADDRLRQAAAVLGAPPGRVWLSVDLPLMGKTLAGASALAYAVALGEFGATSFLARQNPTLPIVIGRLIERPGPANSGMALAAATILALVCGCVVAAVDMAADSHAGLSGSAGGW